MGGTDKLKLPKSNLKLLLAFDSLFRQCVYEFCADLRFSSTSNWMFTYSLTDRSVKSFGACRSVCLSVAVAVVCLGDKGGN